MYFRIFECFKYAVFAFLAFTAKPMLEMALEKVNTWQPNIPTWYLQAYISSPTSYFPCNHPSASSPALQLPIYPRLQGFTYQNIPKLPCNHLQPPHLTPSTTGCKPISPQPLNQFLSNNIHLIALLLGSLLIKCCKGLLDKTSQNCLATTCNHPPKNLATTGCKAISPQPLKLFLSFKVHLVALLLSPRIPKCCKGFIGRTPQDHLATTCNHLAKNP